MKTLIPIALLTTVACGDPMDAEMQHYACQPQPTLNVYVTTGDLPMPDFVLRGEAICYAPNGHLREDTCGWPGLYRMLDAYGHMTYCPASRLVPLSACDPELGAQRAYCTPTPTPG